MDAWELLIDHMAGRRERVAAALRLEEVPEHLARYEREDDPYGLGQYMSLNLYHYVTTGEFEKVEAFVRTLIDSGSVETLYVDGLMSQHPRRVLREVLEMERARESPRDLGPIRRALNLLVVYDEGRDRLGSSE